MSVSMGMSVGSHGSWDLGMCIETGFSFLISCSRTLAFRVMIWI